VGGQIVRTEVSLDLDQAPPQPAAVELADQEFVKEVARDLARVPLEERRV
jgi:hypothetical protein